ncbi:MAG: hypothetical protein R3E86_10940 [Pseudomonadales bacterium]
MEIAQVPNPDYALRSGITAELQIAVHEVMAQKVSPALFALDDAGQIGVRVVNDANRVEYYPVQILRDDVDGVWVTGLPDPATLITVGQGWWWRGREVDAALRTEQPDAGQHAQPRRRRPRMPPNPPRTPSRAPRFCAFRRRSGPEQRGSTAPGGLMVVAAKPRTA